MHSVSAACVVLDRVGNVLLIRRSDNNQWQIPGGVVENGEQPTAAALREVYEETGVSVSLMKLSGVYSNFETGVIAFVFLAKYVQGTLRVSEESKDVVWAAPEEVLKLVPKIFVERIEDALVFGEGVTFRAHTSEGFLEGSAEIL